MDGGPLAVDQKSLKRFYLNIKESNGIAVILKFERKGIRMHLLVHPSRGHRRGYVKVNTMALGDRNGGVVGGSAKASDVSLGKKRVATNKIF